MLLWIPACLRLDRRVEADLAGMAGAGDPRILAYFQHTSLHQLRENNGPLSSDNRLLAWIDPMNTTIQMRQPPLGTTELNKVRPCVRPAADSALCAV